MSCRTRPFVAKPASTSRITQISCRFGIKNRLKGQNNGQTCCHKAHNAFFLQVWPASLQCTASGEGLILSNGELDLAADILG